MSSLFDIAEAINEAGAPIPLDLWAELLAEGYDLSSLTDSEKEIYE